ncbi:MAG TPA: hypothetical protein DF637_04575 [Rikenellaceae bacterium]|nr:hypothetical protein [Rikenellaceae bacterium]
MKTTFKILAVLVAMVGFSASSYAQSSATATATGTILTPIAIANAANMNFGNVASSGTAGTVVLPPAASPTRTTTGGVSLPSPVGTISAATFTVTGNGSATYAITLPSTATTVTSGANTMTVDAFTSSPSGTGTLTSGTQTLYVGATLNVGASQAAGEYVSGTAFTVTVNYN